MKYLMVTIISSLVLVIANLAYKLAEATEKNRRLERAVESNQRQIQSIEGKLDVLIKLKAAP